MKELISAVLFVGLLWGGTQAIKEIHDVIRKEALTKAAQGLPSLEKLANSLTNPRKKPKEKNRSRVNKTAER